MIRTVNTVKHAQRVALDKNHVLPFWKWAGYQAKEGMKLSGVR